MESYLCVTALCTLAYLLETESEDGEWREVGKGPHSSYSFQILRDPRDAPTQPPESHRERKRDGVQIIQPLA